MSEKKLVNDLAALRKELENKQIVIKSLQETKIEMSREKEKLVKANEVLTERLSKVMLKDAREELERQPTHLKSNEKYMVEKAEEYHKRLVSVKNLLQAAIDLNSLDGDREDAFRHFHSLVEDVVRILDTTPPPYPF